MITREHLLMLLGLLLGTASGAACARAERPPPCVPAASSPEDVITALRAWPPFKPLASLPVSIDVAPCSLSESHDEATVTIQVAPPAVQEALSFRVELLMTIERGTARPVDPELIGRQVALLTDTLAGDARQLADDPSVLAWRAALNGELRARYHVTAPSTRCVDLTGGRGAGVATLTWCAGADVIRYDLTDWTQLERPELTSLKAALEARWPGARLVHATMSRARQGLARPWRARGELIEASEADKPRRFEAVFEQAGWRL